MTNFWHNIGDTVTVKETLVLTKGGDIPAGSKFTIESIKFEGGLALYGITGVEGMQFVDADFCTGTVLKEYDENTHSISIAK
jgi:hypothetical protein